MNDLRKRNGSSAAALGGWGMNNWPPTVDADAIVMSLPFMPMPAGRGIGALDAVRPAVWHTEAAWGVFWGALPFARCAFFGYSVVDRPAA